MILEITKSPVTKFREIVIPYRTIQWLDTENIELLLREISKTYTACYNIKVTLYSLDYYTM